MEIAEQKNLTSAQKARITAEKGSKKPYIHPSTKPMYKRSKRRMQDMVSEDTIVEDEAHVYLATVIEYLTAEILDLAGDTIDNDVARKRIEPKHLQKAIRGDEELDLLIKALILPNLDPKIFPELAGHIPSIFENFV
jgi:hypothetical protein